MNLKQKLVIAATVGLTTTASHADAQTTCTGGACTGTNGPTAAAQAAGGVGIGGNANVSVEKSGSGIGFVLGGANAHSAGVPGSGDVQVAKYNHCIKPSGYSILGVWSTSSGNPDYDGYKKCMDEADAWNKKYQEDQRNLTLATNPDAGIANVGLNAMASSDEAVKTALTISAKAQATCETKGQKMTALGNCYGEVKSSYQDAFNQLAMRQAETEKGLADLKAQCATTSKGSSRSTGPKKPSACQVKAGKLEQEMKGLQGQLQALRAKETGTVALPAAKAAAPAPTK